MDLFRKMSIFNKDLSENKMFVENTLGRSTQLSINNIMTVEFVGYL